MPSYTCAYSYKALISQPYVIFAKVTKYDVMLCFLAKQRKLYMEKTRGHIFIMKIFLYVGERNHNDIFLIEYFKGHKSVELLMSRVFQVTLNF